MDYKDPDQTDIDMVMDVVTLLRHTILLNVPPEEDYPGVTSLCVTALVWIAGELLRTVPPVQQATVLAHFQQQMANVMHNREMTH